MCGIIGYTGKQNAAPVIFERLKRLEYRGYDSAGISVSQGGNLYTVKAKGRLEELQRLLPALPDSLIGIGHTRWATHGAPNEINSHPHLSMDGKFAIVHNGIIENADELKNFLTDRGFEIVSATDSEVIAHLIEYYYNGDIKKALAKTTLRLKGAYALGVISAYKDELYALKKDSPLVVGIGKDENFISSDAAALPDSIKEYILLDDNEIAVVSCSSVEIYNATGERIDKPRFINSKNASDSQKAGYPHYMLKEIFFQPTAIKRTLDAIPTPIAFPDEREIRSVILCACGSAYHAALLCSHLFSTLLKIPVTAMIASEFRYCDPLIDKNTLFIAVSQSGETADTLFSLRLASQKGALTAAIVNVYNSSIYREARIKLQTHAGSEVAVATTKGFTTQLAALSLLAYSMAIKEKKATLEDFERERNLILYSVSTLKSLLSDPSPYQKTAEEIHTSKNAFFIGRREDYALAKEGALKLKEISYIHAEAYPAGELKHGAISLIEKGSICFALSCSEDIKEKMLSNVKEIAARGGKVYIITPFVETFAESGKVLPVPLKGSRYCAAAVMQLISYYTAALRGCDIDKPRNLAKSVTVE